MQLTNSSLDGWQGPACHLDIQQAISKGQKKSFLSEIIKLIRQYMQPRSNFQEVQMVTPVVIISSMQFSNNTFPSF
jgi:hypothetical protein